MTPASALETLRQSLWPRHLLASLTHHLAESQRPWIKRALISHFLSQHTVDLGDAELDSPYDYPSFNAFFCRTLKAGARPVCSAHDTLVSPVDGRLSHSGTLDGNVLLQAKGRHYTLAALLATAWQRNQHLRNGAYLTGYLAPADYHRVHLPLAGRLVHSTYVPGRLFSLNPVAVQHVDQLYARNERLVCEFESAFGRYVLVLIGAGFVSGIITAWRGAMPLGTRNIVDFPHEQQDLHYAKGDDIARFRMGSTVLVLLPPGVVRWDERLVPGCRLRMGEAIARLLPASGQS